MYGSMAAGEFDRVYEYYGMVARDLSDHLQSMFYGWTFDVECNVINPRGDLNVEIMIDAGIRHIRVMKWQMDMKSMLPSYEIQWSSNDHEHIDMLKDVILAVGELDGIDWQRVFKSDFHIDEI